MTKKEDDYNNLISSSIELDEEKEEEKGKQNEEESPKNKDKICYNIKKLKNEKPVELNQIQYDDKINHIYIENDKDQLLSFKDDEIFITQSIENSPIFDLAYLYGKGDKKIFVGFKMKAYKDQEKEINLNIKKEDIKEKISKLLINSEFFLGIKIVEFHYFIVGLYIEENLNNIYNNNNYNEIKKYSYDLNEYCKKNELEIILYNPINKKFYDSSKNLSQHINFTDNSNLFKCVQKNKIEYLINKKYLYEKRKEEIDLEFQEFYNTLNKGKEFNNNEYQTNLSLFTTKLKSRLKINGISFLEKANFKDLGNILPTPTVNTFNIFFKKDQVLVENNFEDLKSFVIIMNKDGKYFKDEMVEKEVREMKIDNWLKEFSNINSDLEFYRFKFD